jgi:hypothetical protein
MSSKRVTTWTFDKACAEMEINVLHKAEISVSSTMADDDADLVILGLFGPVDESPEAAVEVVSLTGKTNEANFGEAIADAIGDALVENYKSFKHGATAGATLPTIRVVSAEKKVSCLLLS